MTCGALLGGASGATSGDIRVTKYQTNKLEQSIIIQYSSHFNVVYNAVRVLERKWKISAIDRCISILTWS